MSKFRSALLAVTVALTLAGGTGVVTHADAKAPVKDTTSKTTSMRGGDVWCC